MAFIADTLLPASFRGVRFFASSHSINTGRKIVTHEFVNKENETEDLGNITKTINVEGLTSGIFYYENKLSLEAALSEEGAGILQIENKTYSCVAQPYTVSTSETEIGVARFAMVFTEQKGKILPTASSDVSSLVSNIANNIYAFARDDLNGQYIVKWLENLDAAAQTLRALSNSLNFISESVIGSTSDRTTFETISNNLYDEAFLVARNDGNIGGNIADVIFAFDSIIDDGQTRFDLSSQLFGFGADDVFLYVDGVKNEQRDNNALLINGTTNILALVNMINAARLIDYKTTDDLDSVTSQLNDNYDTLVNSRYLTFSEDMLNQLDSLQVQSRIYFNQLRLTLYKIKEIKVNKMPLTTLVYQYYGSNDNYEEILTLNNIFNPSEISGTIKILEAAA